MEYISESPEQTAQIVAEASKKLLGGDTLLLDGDLGSGKTCVAKSIAEYFGVTEVLTSPTFVILKSYDLPEEKQGVKRIVHMDAYRLHGAPDAESIGLREYLADKSVLLIIEWPENIANILPKETKRISLRYLDGQSRKLSFSF